MGVGHACAHSPTPACTQHQEDQKEARAARQDQRAQAGVGWERLPQKKTNDTRENKQNRTKKRAVSESSSNVVAPAAGGDQAGASSQGC